MKSSVCDAYRRTTKLRQAEALFDTKVRRSAVALDAALVAFPFFADILALSRLLGRHIVHHGLNILTATPACHLGQAGVLAVGAYNGGILESRRHAFSS